IDNRMVLTYAGECYLEHIKQIFAIQAHMRAELDDIARMDRGRLRVGITGIRRPFTIFSVIPQFKKKYPNIALTLNEFGSDKLEEMLEGLELDCIAVNITKKRDCFEYLPVARQEYVLAVHKDHPLVQAAEHSERFKYPVVHPGQLEGCSFVLLSKSHRIRQFADSILDGNRISYSISMQSRTLDGALEAVANGLGCTFTPEVMSSYIRGSQNIRCLSLDTPGTGYDFCLLYRKGAYLPPSTEDFLTMFREAFQREREGL
ncbi:MAG: LysR family transcriptional regulator substrate-binding protein, partial [Lawsonibacter sp.]|nr:LysR family transcriptional regulator substrate-binding protein [Lawsonibacter sp.]